ncbi:MAG: hypothetical protein K9G83_01850 [Hyphomonadaceae bacterium]|nr:hypothetical protein [Hyphomonadaceae bacterium]
MFRSALVAAVVMVAGVPAHAQTSDELTSAAWSCRMTSLLDEPGMDANLAFNADGSLEGWFYVEVPDSGDVISLEFSILGSWSLDGAVISSAVEESEVLAGANNGEAFSPEELAQMADGMGDALSSFSGESTIAYISPHAMVLDELEASISCWR